MSMSLGYRTRSLVLPDIERAIQQDAVGANAARDWWAEGICLFHNPNFDGHICGDSKLMILGYTPANGGYEEIDPLDDALMAEGDAHAILSFLCSTSSQYNVSWLVDVMGSQVGTVENGAASDDLSEFINEIYTSLLLTSDDPDVAMSAAMGEIDRPEPSLIRAKYPGIDD